MLLEVSIPLQVPEDPTRRIPTSADTVCISAPIPPCSWDAQLCSGACPDSPDFSGMLATQNISIMES